MAKRWLKKAIRKMKRSPGTKRAKVLRRRLSKGGDLYKHGSRSKMYKGKRR